MVGSVTEVQTPEEGKGGKSVRGVHRSVTGVVNKCITEGVEE